MLRVTNRSPSTIALYRRAVSFLDEGLAARGMPRAVDAIAREHLEAFFAGMLEQGYAPASANAYYDGIRQFFRWAEEEGEVAEGRNPIRHVRPPMPLQPPDVLDVKEIRTFLKACEGKTFADSRDAALILLMYDTGTRLSEVACLTLDDIDLTDGTLVVLGKDGSCASCPSAPRRRGRSGATYGCGVSIRRRAGRSCGSAPAVR